MVWLLVPVARCSWGAFREVPISDLDKHNDDGLSASDADRLRVEEGQNFFRKVVFSVGECYQRTPLHGQEAWKRQMLVLLASATAISWILGRALARRRFD